MTKPINPLDELKREIDEAIGRELIHAIANFIISKLESEKGTTHEVSFGELFNLTPGSKEIKQTIALTPDQVAVIRHFDAIASLMQEHSIKKHEPLP